MSKDYRHEAALLLTQYNSMADEVIRLRKENERLRDMIEKAVGYGAYDEEYRGEEE